MTVWIPFWFRSGLYLTIWRYGLQFDVQRDRREGTRGGYSFKGDLWTWDVRHPFQLVSDRSIAQ